MLLEFCAVNTVYFELWALNVNFGRIGTYFHLGSYM